MIIQNLAQQPPFTTKDGSTIRSILDRTNAPVANQSLAEATVPAGGATERHYHKLAEEIYFILEGRGEMEIDGTTRTVGPGDGILIPPGAWHTITATETLPLLLRATVCARGYFFRVSWSSGLNSVAHSEVAGLTPCGFPDQFRSRRLRSY